MARLVVGLTSPLLDMVREAGGPVLLNVEAQEIVNCINNRVYPRIRTAFVSAKNANNSDEGINVFLGADRTLADLANAAVQTEIDDKITQIISGTMIQEQVEQIAVSMAAGFLMISRVGIVQAFRNIGLDLVKQADKDLQFLVDGPLFKAAINALIDTRANDQFSVVNIYIAHEMDDTTYDPTTSLAATFDGAQETGIARLWVGKDRIEANVGVGDTYIDVLHNLINAWRTEQTNREIANLPLFNVAFGPDEGKISSVMGTIITRDLVGRATTKSAQLVTGLGYLSLHALNLDDTIDAQMVTLELGRVLAGGEFSLGIQGLVYGTENTYSALTRMGPHSVMIDMKTGRTKSLAEAKSSSKLQIDTFYFQALPIPGTASFDATGYLDAGESVSITINNKTFVYTATVNNDTGLLVALQDEINQRSLTTFAVQLSAIVSGTVLTVEWYDTVSEGQAFAITTTGLNLVLSGVTPTFSGYQFTTKLRTAGSFRYRTGPLLATGTTIRQVNIPANTDLMDALQLLADDLYTNQDSLMLMAALRSPVVLTPTGTPAAAPSMQLIPFKLDDEDSRIVFDMVTVPPEVIFAPNPKERVTNNSFDGKPKSLVLDPVYLKRSTPIIDSGGADATKSVAMYVVPAETPLQKKLKDFDRQFGRG